MSSRQFKVGRETKQIVKGTAKRTISRKKCITRPLTQGSSARGQGFWQKASGTAAPKQKQVVKKMRASSNMGDTKSGREKWGAAARKCLGDRRLEAFLRACRGTTCILACRHINEELDQGETLDSIFNTQDDYGYELAVRKCGEDEFEFDFGYLAGPLMGDGGCWVVRFDSDDRVKQIEEKGNWVS
jgi:hypothetical protein